jgi:hypothetical protein
MAKAGADVSDDVIKVAILGVGVLAIYMIMQARDVAGYGASKVDDTQSWLSRGWSKAWGSPNWAWRETLGTGGLGLTGGSTSNTDPENRKLLGYDDNSWLWGWGPKK